MKRSSSLGRMHLKVAVCGLVRQLQVFAEIEVTQRSSVIPVCSFGRGLSQTSTLKPPLCSIRQCFSSFRVHVESHLTRRWFDLVFFFAFSMMMISDFDLLFCVATTGSEDEMLRNLHRPMFVTTKMRSVEPFRGCFSHTMAHLPGPQFVVVDCRFKLFRRANIEKMLRCGDEDRGFLLGCC